jgi:uncharacterized protein (DUF885 family)
MTLARRKRRWPRIVLSLAVLGLIVGLVPTVWGKPWSIRHFYARALLKLVWQSPMTCSSLHLLDFRSDQLDDFSPEARAKVTAMLRDDLAMLHRYDREGLTRQEQVSWDVMDWFLSDLLSRDGHFGFEIYAVDQLSGLHVTLPTFLTTQHTIASKADAQKYIARVRASGVAFDQIIAWARDDAARSVVPPRLILTRVRADASAFAQLPTAESPVALHLKTKVAALTLTDAEKAELGKAVDAAIDDTLRPAWLRYVSLVDELSSRATDEAGIWKLPRGEPLYRAWLAGGTASPLEPERVHQLGLEQVALREAEVRAVFAERGAPLDPASDVGPAIRAMEADPRYLYPADEAGQKQMISDFQAIIDDADQRVAPFFHDRPKIGVKVEAVPAFRAQTSPGGQYFPPPLDNSRGGTFFANVSNIGAMPKFLMRTLAFHETVPGHHFQIVIARQQTSLPMFRQLVPINAYVEGWALYAEQLAAESGFQSDPMDRVGFLAAQLHRSARLVVDTGLHAQRWSREQAIDYMMRHTAQPEKEVIIEVERYMVWPGQACGYTVGMLKLLELRERAKTRLGPRFDLRAFHDTVLRAGAVPMPILERVVDDWIADQG